MIYGGCDCPVKSASPALHRSRVEPAPTRHIPASSSHVTQSCRIQAHHTFFMIPEAVPPRSTAPTVVVAPNCSLLLRRGDDGVTALDLQYSDVPVVANASHITVCAVTTQPAAASSPDDSPRALQAAQQRAAAYQRALQRGAPATAVATVSRGAQGAAETVLEVFVPVLSSSSRGVSGGGTPWLCSRVLGLLTNLTHSLASNHAYGLAVNAFPCPARRWSQPPFHQCTWCGTSYSVLSLCACVRV